MSDLDINITFESNGIEIEKAVFVEYEISGGYEAPSMDSEGCNKEADFTVFDSVTGKEFPQWIVEQIYDEVEQLAFSDYQKECDGDAAEYAASQAEDDYLFG
jgi:hypothetical protein